MEGDWASTNEQVGVRDSRPFAVDAAAVFASQSEHEDEDEDEVSSSSTSAAWDDFESHSEPESDFWDATDLEWGAPSAAAIPVPPAGVQPSAKRPRQAAKSTGMAAKIDPARWSKWPLSHETAYRLLQDPAVTACGTRPPFLRNVERVEGQIYKEHPSQYRRVPGTDSWIVKGGPKGGSIQQVAANAWVKRAYGAQACQHL